MMQMDPNQSIGASHWGGPMMGNGGPTMIGGPIGMPNIGNTGFNYNYGSSNPSNPSFGWPQQWGNNNYGVPPHQAQQSAQGYGAYDYNGPIGYTNSTAAPAPSSYGANGNNWNSWNPNIAPNNGSGTSGEMYRPQSGPNMQGPPPPSAGGNLSKPGSEYNGAAAYNGAYTNYYSEQQFSNQNRPRSYGNNEQYPAF